MHVHRDAKGLLDAPTTLHDVDERLLHDFEDLFQPRNRVLLSSLRQSLASGGSYVDESFLRVAKRLRLTRAFISQETVSLEQDTYLPSPVVREYVSLTLYRTPERVPSSLLDSVRRTICQRTNDICQLSSFNCIHITSIHSTHYREAQSSRRPHSLQRSHSFYANPVRTGNKFLF